MSDLLGYKTKKVTTYARRGNRTNIIPIHADISPIKDAHAAPVSTSPTTPLKRPPLTSKSSQVFLDPVMPSKVDKMPVKIIAKPLPVKTKPVLKAPATPHDSPRVIRRMHRPGRAVLPPSPSVYAASSTPRRSGHSRLHSVEIPHSVGPPKRQARSKLGQGGYRELSESVSEALDRIKLSSPPSSPIRPTSQQIEILPTIPISSVIPSEDTSPTLESVCAIPSLHSFTDIHNIAASLCHPSSSNDRPQVQISKAGEATYSEVYSIRTEKGANLVMKVIPITRNPVEIHEDGKSPWRSPAEDVAKEVEITKRMSGLEGGGFVTFHGAYIVQGEYDSILLTQWDQYADTHCSENVRPSSFGSEQEYVIIFLRDGGDDLEAFTFAKETGWIQAAGVFWQVADALARAEDRTEFEHRDLHEGQILIEPVTRSANSNPLHPLSSGVRATIIDFGLSRLKADVSGRIVSTCIPDEVLEGEGEQWDVYREITKRVGSDWEGYHPITNLLWLQYILNLLLLRTPSLVGPRMNKTPSTTTAVSRTRSTVRAVVGGKANVKSMTIEQEQSVVAYTNLKTAKDAIDGALSSKLRRGGVKMDSASDLIAWAKGKSFLR